MSNSGEVITTPQDILKTANKWVAEAEEHIKAADYCHEQAEMFLGQLVVADDYKPTLILIEGEKS
jgi:hypothetical protein